MRASRPGAQRGAGSLIVVMVLFFIVSLVAAYASRNMIFEQKTSANQYRSTQAFEAAEAGIEWGLAMLNSGRMDSSCQPSTTGTTFRSRYLNINATTGAMSARTWLNGGSQVALNAVCVRAATGWSCSCPDSSGTWPTNVAGAVAPAFRLTFLPGGVGGRPGLITLRSQSCTRLDPTCLNDNLTGGQGDAVASMTALVALKGAVAAPPAAALSAGGAVATGSNAVRVVNTDPAAGGITVQARGAVVAPGMVLTSAPGAPGSASVVADDSRLPATADLMFNTVFGMHRALYPQQPASIVLTCPAQCGAAALSALVAKNPGRMVWLEGDVSLNTAVDIGSAAEPTVLVVHGSLTASAAVRIYGLVYGFSSTPGSPWTVSGLTLVQGATVSEGDFQATSASSLVFDLGILNNLRRTSGSFVRVPGGWKDF